MSYSVVVYHDINDGFGGITVIASIDNINSLERAEELEALYQGEHISSYVDGYVVVEDV